MPPFALIIPPAVIVVVEVKILALIVLVAVIPPFVLAKVVPSKVRLASALWL